MSPIKRLFYNTGSSFLNRILNPLTSFILVLLIARKLGVQQLGQYSTVLAMLFIFESIASLGFSLLYNAAGSPKSV